MRFLPTLAALFLASLASAEPVKVVTDIPAVHSLVSQVGGDLVEVSLLADGSSDLHHMQLRPSQTRLLAQADLVVWIGPELTPWLDRAMSALASETSSLTLADGMEGEDDHGHDDDHHDDPHIWLDPVLMAENALKIGSKLAEIDPDHSATYSASGAATQAALLELALQVQAQLDPVRAVPFVVSHDGYGFFADRFGLTIAGSISDIAANAASARTLADLTDAVEGHSVRCIFGEVQHDQRLARMLAEKGAKLGDDLDPGGLLLQPGPDLYSQLIRQMADALSDCLSS